MKSLAGIYLLFFAFSFFLLKNSLYGQPPVVSSVLGTKSVSSEVDLSASVGENRFSLFGYTSPYGLVTFEGVGVFDQTYADKQGYFEFKNRFSPTSPREACLSVKDQFGRVSTPVCLPSFSSQKNINVGPIIMPPTLSLNNPQAGSDYYVGDEVILSGQTIPNSQVNLSVFAGEQKGLSLIKSAEAFSLPKFDSNSDAEGNFSVTLPSSAVKNYRLFAQTDYNNSQSPKSLTLNFNILPIWMIIINLFFMFLNLIKSRFLELLILAEIIILASYFLRRYLHPYHLKKNRALALKNNLLPIIYAPPSIV
ncbi:hypothetical protein GYA28_03790 [Candidatus Roizmanbacteria bacterium]|nr:hypothetical protein [Candidatus Roizmanbacteria bacterium]